MRSTTKAKPDKKPDPPLFHYCEGCGGRFPLRHTPSTRTHFLAFKVVASVDGNDTTLVMRACGPLKPDR